MIILERQLPIPLLQEIALYRHLPQRHPKKTEIEVNVKKKWKGHNGEKAADYVLRTLPYNKYKVYHGLRLIINHDVIQIDNFVLSGTVGSIIEVKNIPGPLHYDSKFNQWIQKTTVHNDIRYPNPLDQVYRHYQFIRRLFNSHEISIPIEYMVANSNPATILTSDSNNSEVTKRILHIEHLPQRIEEISSNHHRRPKLTSPTSEQISRILLKAHKPLKLDILNTYDIKPEDLLWGVLCTSCNRFSMKRIKGRWQCPHCHHESRTAHIQTLIDYFLIVDDVINNRVCREVLGLNSTTIANRLLKAMKLKETGITSARKYDASEFMKEMDNWISSFDFSLH